MYVHVHVCVCMCVCVHVRVCVCVCFVHAKEVDQGFRVVAMNHQGMLGTHKNELVHAQWILLHT